MDCWIACVSDEWKIIRVDDLQQSCFISNISQLKFEILENKFLLIVCVKFSEKIFFKKIVEFFVFLTCKLLSDHGKN